MLKQRRRTMLKEFINPAVEQVRQILALRGVGMNSAWLYVMELFAARVAQPPGDRCTGWADADSTPERRQPGSKSL